VAQVAPLLEDLAVEVIGLVAVQVDDFQAVGQHAARPVAEAGLVRLGQRFAGRRTPVLERQQHRVDAARVAAQRAARVEELLEHLVVAGEFGFEAPAERAAPEAQRVLERLGGEVGGDREAGRRRALEQAQRDAEQLEVGLARLVEQAHIAAARGVAPKRRRQLEVMDFDALDRAQHEGAALVEDERREQLDRRVDHAIFRDADFRQRFPIADRHGRQNLEMRAVLVAVRPQPGIEVVERLEALGGRRGRRRRRERTGVDLELGHDAGVRLVEGVAAGDLDQRVIGGKDDRRAELHVAHAARALRAQHPLDVHRAGHDDHVLEGVVGEIGRAANADGEMRHEVCTCL
jgi:hypothetical protein